MIKPLRWLLWFMASALLVLGGTWVLSMPGKDIRGVWATEGYGMRIDIGRTAIDIYEVTAVSCRHAQRIPANQWLIGATQEITLSRDGAQLRVDVGGALTPIKANRAPSLPPTCPDTPNAPGSARDNFDVLWQTMREHYPFFERHGIDWMARRTALRPDVDAPLNNDALFDLFKETLAGIDDGQVLIRTPRGMIHSPAGRPDWFDSRHLVRDTTLAQFDDLRQAANTGLLYGWAAPGVGYVYVGHLDTAGGFNTQTQDQAENGFAEIALAFAAADAVILDLRYTPGGKDAAALAYARYFTDTALSVLGIATHTARGFGPTVDVSVEPQGSFHIDQPTLVLTSGFTSATAEVFTMIMRQLPQVTLMGTTTAGAVSDVVQFTLPNGWVLGLPHKRYLDATGRSFAGIGIAPDLAVPVDVVAATTGRDATLDQAIRYLTEQ